MAAPKRTEIQHERDLEVIADLYLRGFTQYGISQELPKVTNAKYTVTTAIINRDLKIIRGRWKESSLISWSEKKDEELAKIDKIEFEAVQAWEKSKKPFKSIRQSTGDKSTEEKKIIERDGNPRFLEVWIKCSERRCKLLGLDEPQKVKIEEDENRPLTNQERSRRLLAIIANGHPEGNRSGSLN